MHSSWWQTCPLSALRSKSQSSQAAASACPQPQPKDRFRAWIDPKGWPLSRLFEALCIQWMDWFHNNSRGNIRESRIFSSTARYFQGLTPFFQCLIIQSLDGKNAPSQVQTHATRVNMWSSRPLTPQPLAVFDHFNLDSMRRIWDVGDWILGILGISWEITPKEESRIKTQYYCEVRRVSFCLQMDQMMQDNKQSWNVRGICVWGSCVWTHQAPCSCHSGASLGPLHCKGFGHWHKLKGIQYSASIFVK